MGTPDDGTKWLDRFPQDRMKQGSQNIKQELKSLILQNSGKSGNDLTYAFLELLGVQTEDDFHYNLI
jgi:hypothetical protein